MKKRFQKFGAILLLTFPFLVFSVILVAVAVRYGREMATMMSIPFASLFEDDLYYIAAAFLVCLVAEIYIFLRAVNSYAVKTASLEALGREEEKAAKLLVRRDLELTQANERLKKLDDVKSGFISVVAHQLRNPLSGIKWTLNLLINGDLGALLTEQKTFLMKAYESNDRMISLVNDMLGADRFESGKTRYELQPVSLADVVDSVLFELLPQSNARGLTIRFASKQAKVPKVHADPEKIRAVFQNLLENSVKYSRQHGIIEIGFEQTSALEVTVWIKDDGIGIPKEQQKSIFERFFRAPNAIRLETDGSGLGLFIVKSIIERQGGRISFESEEGKGVTFTFTIPIEKDGGVALHKPVQATEKIGL